MINNIPAILLEEATTGTTSEFYEVSLTKGDTIVSVVVESFSDLVAGITEGFRAGFEELVLNEDKDGLSILAIWLLVFLGFGIAMRVVGWLVRKLCKTETALEGSAI